MCIRDRSDGINDVVDAGEGNNEIVIGSNSASANKGTYTSGSGNDIYTIHSGRHTITSGEGDDSFTIKDYAGFSNGYHGLSQSDWFTIRAGNNDTGDKGAKTLNLGRAPLELWTSGAGDDVITVSYTHLTLPTICSV